MTMAAAAINAAATLGGAYLMSKSGRGGAQQSGEQTVKTLPPDYIEGEYEALADQIANLRTTGLLSEIQTLSPYERSLVESGMARAAAPAPFQAAGEGVVSQLLAGKSPMLQEAADIYRGTGSIMDSPEFLAASERAVQRAMSPVSSKFAGSGRLGSGAFADALASSSFGAMAPLALEARRQDISADLSRARGLKEIGDSITRGMVSGIEAGDVVGAQPFQQIERGLSLGGLLSGEDYALRQAPVTGAQRLGELLKLATVGEQTVRPLYSTPRASTGDILGATIGQSLMDYGTDAFGNYLSGLGNTPPSPAISPTNNYTPYGQPIYNVGGTTQIDV